MTGPPQSTPESLRSVVSTTASTVEEHLPAKTRTCAPSMFRNPYSDHFDLFAGLKSEQTLEKEAGADVLHDVKHKVESTAGEAKAALADNVAPWEKPKRRGSEDCVRQSRHCECSLGEAWDSIFKKTQGAVQDAEHKVVQAEHKIEDEAQKDWRYVQKKTAELESSVGKQAENLGAGMQAAAKNTQSNLQKAEDAASKAAQDGKGVVQKAANDAGHAVQKATDQAADNIKSAAK